jgi:hypothetical protein
VRVVLELDAGSTWGGDCTIEQIERQAARETLERIERGVLGNEVKVLVPPVVDVVIVKGDR